MAEGFEEDPLPLELEREDEEDAGVEMGVVTGVEDEGRGVDPAGVVLVLGGVEPPPTEEEPPEELPFKQAELVEV